MSLPVVALLAGGLATRLGELTADTPKSMLQVAGRPFIAWQLELLRRQGVSEVVVCAGHFGEKIQEFVGDGLDFGLSVRFSYDGERLLGTGGALKKALPVLGDEFFVLYGDSYLEAPFTPVAEAFFKAGKAGLMTVYRNQGKFDSSNVEFENGQILAYSKVFNPRMAYIDYGLGLFSAKAVAAEPTEAFDLGALQARLLSEGQLAAFEVSTRFYEIGSAAGLAETNAYLGS